MSVRRTFLVGALFGYAACGDNAAPTIRVVAEGARWMAVRPSPDAAWARLDGDDVQFEARGVFDVAVVCREDIGDGFSLRATADDLFVYDEEYCQRSGSIVPQFDITGRVSQIFVGTSASYLPNIVGGGVDPGTYDVVAMQLGADPPQRIERMQVIRDVVLDGATPIPIDVDRYGLPPATVMLTVNGEQADYAYITGWTGNGTWFNLQSRSYVVLPVELTRPSDRQVARIYRGDAWADAPVHAGENDLALPPDAVAATFSHAQPPSVTWRSATAWERVTFSAQQWNTSGPGLPRWRVVAYPSSWSTSDGGASWSVDLPMPDVAGWNAGWMTDMDAPHIVFASWERARADGGRGGISKSERQ